MLHAARHAGARATRARVLFSTLTPNAPAKFHACWSCANPSSCASSCRCSRAAAALERRPVTPATLPTSSNQAKLMAEAMHIMPQGVAENYRFWGEDKTVFVEKTKGCEFWDVDGKKYVDFRLGYGPIILGYRDPRVDAAVCDQIMNSGTRCLRFPHCIFVTTTTRHSVGICHRSRRSGRQASAQFVSKRTQDALRQQWH